MTEPDTRIEALFTRGWSIQSFHILTNDAGEVTGYVALLQNMNRLKIAHLKHGEHNVETAAILDVN